MDLLNCLMQGDVAAFNKAKAAGGTGDLFAAELAELTLVGIDLSGLNLSKSDLTGADLRGAQLLKTDLSGIDGAGLILRGAIGLRANLSEAFLEGADLSEGDWTKANAAEAELGETQAAKANWTKANLKGARVLHGHWREALLREAQVGGADFREADLTGANLSEAQGARFSAVEANLERIQAVRARLSGAVFTRANLRGAVFREASLMTADFSGANLTGADFSAANLTGAIFTGATLTGVNFAGASLEGVDWSDLDLAGVEMVGQDPHALGLSTPQIAALAAWGVQADMAAPVILEDPVVARRGARVAVVWRNPEPWVAPPPPEEGMPVPRRPGTLRYVVMEGGLRSQGVLPVLEAEVESLHLLEDGGAFTLLATVRRPAGVFLLRWTLSLAGVFAPASMHLGYAPISAPIVANVEGKTWIWGITSRGPGAVAQFMEDDALQTGFTAKIQTAVGFYAANRPVLQSKSPVLLAVSTSAVGEPLRVPDGFPGLLASATLVDDKVLAAWVEPRRGERPGGVRAAWVARREDPVERVWGWESAVKDLSLWTEGERAWVAWTEPGGLRVASYPELRRDEIPLAPGERAVFGGGGAPVVLAYGAQGGARVLALEGPLLGQISSHWPTGAGVG